MQSETHLPGSLSHLEMTLIHGKGKIISSPTELSSQSLQFGFQQRCEQRQPLGGDFSLNFTVSVARILLLHTLLPGLFIFTEIAFMAVIHT